MRTTPWTLTFAALSLGLTTTVWTGVTIGAASREPMPAARTSPARPALRIPIDTIILFVMGHLLRSLRVEQAACRRASPRAQSAAPPRCRRGETGARPTAEGEQAVVARRQLF